MNRVLLKGCEMLGMYRENCIKSEDLRMRSVAVNGETGIFLLEFLKYCMLRRHAVE